MPEGTEPRYKGEKKTSVVEKRGQLLAVSGKKFRWMSKGRGTVVLLDSGENPGTSMESKTVREICVCGISPKKDNLGKRRIAGKGERQHGETKAQLQMQTNGGREVQRGTLL